jgi:mono/diheme cytochrome c family protein
MKKALFLAFLLGACGGGDSGTGSDCPTASAPTYVTFGKTFFDTYCTSCHSSARTGTMRGGAPAGLNYDTLEGIRKDLSGIDGEAAAGPNGTNTGMPISLPRPSDAERTTLGQFLACEQAQ